MADNITEIKIDNELRICPACGYRDGFHSMFRRIDGDRLKWMLICPSCHQIFDPGLEVSTP